MKLKRLVLAVASIAALGPGAAIAGKTEAQKARTELGENSVENLRIATLKVTKVDPKKHKVTFEATVSPEADFEKNGKPIKIDNLKEGDTIKAAFDPKSGDVVAADIVKNPEK